jgi:phage gp29-like protein
MPRFVFDLKETADLTAMANTLPALVNVGVQIPQQWVHEKLGIPQPVNNEPVLVTQAPSFAAMTKQPQKHKIAALSAMLNAAYPDQAALDAVIEQIPPQRMQTQVDELLAPLLSALEDGADEQTVLGLLADAFPEMDESALTDALHRLLFAADAFGRLNV